MQLQYKCKICDKSFNTLYYHVKIKHNLDKKEYYDTYLKSDSDGFCSVCGNPTLFSYNKTKYSKYCSNRCVQNDPKNKEIHKNALLNHTEDDKKRANDKRKETTLLKYGVENISQSNVIKAKKEETCLINYNCRNSFLIKSEKDETLLKSQETKLNLYGDKYYVNLDKAKQTKLKKYGDANYNNSDKMKLTWQNKSKNDINNMLEKRHITNNERYDCDEFFQSNIFKEKFKITMLERYGVEHASQHPKLLGHSKFLGDDGNYYDSSWEYYFRCYLIEHNIKHEYQPCKFNYFDKNNKQHSYIPDFKIINENNMIEYIEIKGEQFFDENNNFINPFDSSENANILAELKYKCMQDNNVKILRKQDLLNLGIKIK